MAALHRSIAIVGTAMYMAPEQAMRSKEELTTAADIYSLGAILYEFLTGRAPILGESYVDTLWKVVNETPLPPRERNPTVPLDLEMICLKCLSKAPAERYGSALELAEDLDRWRAGDAISLHTPSKKERAWRWVKRNRLTATLLGTVALLMIVGTVGSLLAAFHISAARDLANRNAEQADKNAEEASLLATQEKSAHEAAEKALSQAEIESKKAEKARCQAEIERKNAETARAAAEAAGRRTIACSYRAMLPTALALLMEATCSARWSGMAKPWIWIKAIPPAKMRTGYDSPLCCIAVRGWCKFGSIPIFPNRLRSVPTAATSSCSTRRMPAFVM